MKRFKLYALASAAAFCFGAYPSAAVKADEGKLDLNAWLTLQYIGEESHDLGTGQEEYEDSIAEQLQIFAEYDFNPDTLVYFHGRALNIEGETGFDDDTGDAVSLDSTFLELRELFVRHEGWFGIAPSYVQVGRQRVQEPRAIWWNSDQDLVKVGYDTTLFSSFIAAGEDMRSYRNNRDDDYRADDRDRFRVLGEASWQHRYNHFLEGRFLYEDDHSGLEATGTNIDANNIDDEDQNLLWVGVRATGETRDILPHLTRLKYRADLMGLYGEEDELQTAPTAFSNARTVTGSTTRDVRAWGFDGNVILDPYDSKGPAFTLGYAFGSGEEDPNGTGRSREFRQTDLDGSSSRIGLERNQRRNYGEVLRPELSNLHIASAAVDYPFTEHSDVNVTYFNYTLDELATRHHSAGISATMNGTDKNVGQAVDVGLYVDVDDEFNLKVPYTYDTDFRMIVGSFFPGDAYDPTGNHEAFRFFSEVKFKF